MMYVTLATGRNQRLLFSQNICEMKHYDFGVLKIEESGSHSELSVHFRDSEQVAELIEVLMELGRAMDAAKSDRVNLASTDINGPAYEFGPVS
jgi:hypothetical protein